MNATFLNAQGTPCLACEAHQDHGREFCPDHELIALGCSADEVDKSFEEFDTWLDDSSDRYEESLYDYAESYTQNLD